ncbi:uncharacterized protein METZ01_LOCUS371966, partial [marine metagenome]
YDGTLHLFSTVSFSTNQTAQDLGTTAINDMFGEFLGVPIGVMFVVIVASLATGRSAPTFIIITIAIAGIMAAIGFFTINQGVWGLIVIAGCIGVLVGKKLF